MRIEHEDLREPLPCFTCVNFYEGHILNFKCKDYCPKYEAYKERKEKLEK